MTDTITITVDSTTVLVVVVIILVLLLGVFEIWRNGWNAGYDHGWTDCGDRFLNNPPYSDLPGEEEDAVWLGRIGGQRDG